MSHEGQIVTKDELLERFWPNVNVTENTLTRAIADIRKAIRDDAATLRTYRQLLAAAIDLLRSLKGVEFAVGPNLSAGGIAIALAGGVTIRTGNLNIPMNIAAVPSKNGLRVSMLAGFNTRRH